MNNVKLIFAISIITILLVSILVCRALIFLIIPISVLFRENFIDLICIIEKLPLTYVCDVKGGLAYSRCGSIIAVYRVEPLINLERLKSKTYVSVCRDFIRRILVSDNVAIGFLVSNSDKYLIVNIYRGQEREVENVLSNIENVLSEYFTYVKLCDDNLREFLRYRRVFPKKFTIFSISTTLVLTILLGYYTLIIFTIFIILISYVYTRLVVYDIFRDLIYYSYSCRTLFVSRDFDNLKSDALQISRFRGKYLIIFRRFRDLELIARDRLHRYQESLIVREKGRYYFEVLAWRNVINRLSSGEEPLLVSLHVEDFRYFSTYFNFSIGNLLDIFNLDKLKTYALSDDVSIFIPFTAASGIVSRDNETNTHRRIYLGFDRSGKDVIIDLDSLPNNHMLIVGPTGMGKSWTAKSLILEFVKNGISVIIIDPHGEYYEYLKNSGIDDILEIKFPHRFINVFDRGRLDIYDKIYRICIAFKEVVNVDVSYNLVKMLEILYRYSIDRDVLKFLQVLERYCDDINLKIFICKLYRYFTNCEFLDLRNVLRSFRVVIFNFRDILHDPDVLIFLMILLVDKLYISLMSSRPISGIRNVVVIDEAYYIMNSRVIELCIKGFRKFGTGFLLISQTISDVKYDVLQNVGTVILLGGPDPYVESIASVYLLNDDDLTWLSTSLHPGEYRRTIKALLIMGPLKRHVYVKLR